MADDGQSSGGGGGGGGSGGSRPSFASFWKKGKEKLKGKDITFVEQGGAQKEQQKGDNSTTSPSETNKSSPSQKEKAQIRRAQVRKAQIQHRQRKANYVKELELDVSRYRELIARVEHEAAAIKTENDAIRIRLRAAGVDETAIEKMSELASGDILTGQMQGQQLEDHGRKPPAPEEEGEMFADIDMDDITVTVAYDETIGAPCFQVSSNSSGESVRTPITPNTTQGEQILSPAQEYQVINFILSLEHPCWNHFPLGGFHQHAEATPAGDAQGHILMTTAHFMASAPDAIYNDRDAAFAKPQKAVSKSSPNPAPTPAPLQWQGPSVSLESLYGLAQSLNPGDKEITPVQAWFELANQYPVEVLLEPKTMEQFKREFVGVVRCNGFGATMERVAYESVVSRVLGLRPSQ